MLAVNLETQFNRGDTVHIEELNRSGRVIAIHFDDAGLSYRVRYFDGGEARDTYFYPDELTSVAATKPKNPLQP